MLDSQSVPVKDDDDMAARIGHLIMPRVGYIPTTSKCTASDIYYFPNAKSEACICALVYYMSRSGICKSSPGSIIFNR